MSRLLLLVACFFLAVPRGAVAQSPFQIVPDTVVSDEGDFGIAVVTNADDNSVTLDSLTMLWEILDGEVFRDMAVTVFGQPAPDGEKYFFGIRPTEDFSTQVTDLTFASGDTHSMEFWIPCPVFAKSGREILSDTLLFHADGLVAVDSLFLEGFPPGCEIGNEPSPGGKPTISIKVHPNPALHFVDVELNLEASSETSVSVFDTRGRRVAVLHDGVMPVGEHTFMWDSSEAAPGVYHIRVEADDVSASRSVTIAR